MNERMRELAEQAQLDGDAIHYYSPAFAEKFAKLIVRECIRNMENSEGDIDYAIWKTKKDFGIEE